jgi:ribosomal-protein-alanine N-acetyltransferase
MAEKPGKSPGKSFIDIFDKFGSALSEIFDDPELKEQARMFGKSAARSASTFASRFKDEEVKNSFRDVGNAAEEFGRSVADYFKSEKTDKSAGKEAWEPRNSE